jgi:hypothetical protein
MFLERVVCIERCWVVRLAVILSVVAAASACEERSGGIELPQHAFQFPVSVRVHPDGFALVLSSNYDLSYTSGSIRTIDLNQLAERVPVSGGDEAYNYHQDLILDDASVAVDSYGGDLVLSEDGALAIAPLRESKSLVLLDVLTTENGQEKAAISLSCWRGAEKPSGKFPRCGGARNVIQFEEDDPYGVLWTSGVPAEEGISKIAMVSYLRSGKISVVGMGPREILESNPKILYALETSGVGASSLAQSPKTGWIYSSSRYTGSQSTPVYFFEPSLGQNANVEVVDFYHKFLGSETRSLAFLDDGVTLAVLVRNPDILAFLDTTLGPDGKPMNRYAGSVVTTNNPSLVRIHGDLIIVTSAQEDVLLVVDARTGHVLKTIDNVCRGPFDVDFLDRVDQKWAVIACFEEDTVAVMDINPASSTFLQILAKVGKPSERG